MVHEGPLAKYTKDWPFSYKSYCGCALLSSFFRLEIPALPFYLPDSCLPYGIFWFSFFSSVPAPVPNFVENFDSKWSEWSHF